jgi:hypothetical protein
MFADLHPITDGIRIPDSLGAAVEDPDLKDSKTDLDCILYLGTGRGFAVAHVQDGTPTATPHNAIIWQCRQACRHHFRFYTQPNNTVAS